MSYVQPNWQDVRFNHQAAREAIEQCRSAAAELRTITEQRNALAAMARDGWQGRYRDEFDEDLPSFTSGARTMVAVLESLAQAIEAAAEGALQEQGSREQQRQRWREQQAVQAAAGRPPAGGAP